MPQKTSKPTATDLERFKREAAQEAPIAHTAADGPYDAKAEPGKLRVVNS